MPGTLGINEHDLSLSVHSEDSDLSKDIYGEQDEQDGDPAGNPSNTTDSYLQSVFSFSCFI